MKIERKRNQTPCYWEDRGGCRKLHCVFQHKNRAAMPATAAAAATVMQVPQNRKPNVPIQMSPVVVDYRLVQQIL